MAIHPLIGTNFGRTVAVRLEGTNGFRMISLINFEGEKRTFTDVELCECRNGFVAEISPANTWPDFTTFRAFHSRPRIRDEWAAGDGMRHVRYEREGLSLAIQTSPVSGGIKFRAVNGQLAETPKFRVSGIDLPRTPLL